MMQGTSSFTYLEVPKGCEDAIPELDVNLPHFARLIKKIMRKMSKGAHQVCRPLIQMDDNGEAVQSDYEIVGTLENEPRDMLLACLPSANEKTELYRFPFVRLTVRKINSDSCNGPSSSPNGPSEEPTLKSISDRLEQISSDLTALTSIVAPKQARQRITAAHKSTPHESIPDSSQKSAETPVKEPSRIGSTARSKNQCLDPHTSWTSTTVSKHTPGSTPQSHFADQLDDTIDEVLSCIRRGKDEQLFVSLRSKLLTNLEALPPPSAQIVDSTTDTVEPIVKQASPRTPKTPKKRVLSPDPHSDDMIAPAPTKMRFMPITDHTAHRHSVASPELLSYNRTEEDELNDVINALTEKESQKIARQEAKQKASSAKHSQHRSSKVTSRS